MGLDQHMVPALLVALFTWGGVFLYLLRLERLTRDLEQKVASMNHRDTEAQSREEGKRSRGAEERTTV